ncbi:MAG: outer membrane beta-barrel protein [Chitinophagaceae bacterium]|nr:outer membrane beta-barrel protein [Rubrivivax sp.]
MCSFARFASGRRRDIRRGAWLAGLSFATVWAHAGDFSVGAGAGLDRGRTVCVDTYACDHDSASAKLFLGYRVTEGVELQAVFFDAGRFDGGGATPAGTPFGGRFKVSGVGLAAGYRWAFMPGWSLKGQVGVASVRTRFGYAAPFSGDVSKSTTQPLAGLSVAYRIAPNWQLSLDYDETRFKVHTTRGSLRMLGVAAQYAF